VVVTSDRTYRNAASIGPLRSVTRDTLDTALGVHTTRSRTATGGRVETMPVSQAGVAAAPATEYGDHGLPKAAEAMVSAVRAQVGARHS